MALCSHKCHLLLLARKDLKWPNLWALHELKPSYMSFSHGCRHVSSGRSDCTPCIPWPLTADFTDTTCSCGLAQHYQLNIWTLSSALPLLPSCLCLIWAPLSVHAEQTVPLKHIHYGLAPPSLTLHTCPSTTLPLRHGLRTICAYYSTDLPCPFAFCTF